jgi:GNAT superfamily N-acetyltransferase
MTIVRAAVPSDLEALVALCGVLGYPAEAAEIRARLAGIQGSAADVLLVAEHDQAVAGWLQAHVSWVLESGHRAEIVGLVVAPDSRRLGAGRLLVAAAERWAEDLGAATITVRSSTQRVESHRFYPAIGYERKKTQEVYRKVLGGPFRPPANP